MSSQIYLFADNTKLFRIIKDDNDTQILQHNIDLLVYHCFIRINAK